MTGKTNSFYSFWDKVTSIAGYSAGIFPIIMSLIIFYDVFLRFLFNSPTTWVTETTEYMMAFVVFIGACYTSSKNAHVSVEIVTERLGVRGKSICAKIATIVNLVFILVLLRQSIIFWWQAYSLGMRSWGMLSFPLVIPYAFLLIGVLLLAVTEMLKLIKKGA